MEKAPDWRIYIDESGDHSNKQMDEAGKRYLCLTGCIIGLDYYKTTYYQDFEELKQKHFPHEHHPLMNPLFSLGKRL